MAAWILKYDVTTIAPYALGHVELKIPYPRLNGILKLSCFPAVTESPAQHYTATACQYQRRQGCADIADTNLPAMW